MPRTFARSILCLLAFSGFLYFAFNPGRVSKGKKPPLTTCVEFSANGDVLAVGCRGTVYVVDVASGTVRRELGQHRARIQGLAFSRAGDLLVSAEYTGLMHVFVLTGKAERRTINVTDGPIWAMDVHPSGRLIGTAAQNRVVLWDVASGQPTRTILESEFVVADVAFSPDGTLLAVALADGTVQLVDCETWSVRHILNAHQGWARSISFSRSGKTLASGGGDARLRLWDTETGELQSDFKQSSWVKCIDFAPDGKHVAVGTADGTVSLWNVETSESRTIFSRPGPVLSVSLSPTDKLVAAARRAFTSSGDQDTFKLWDWPTGAELKAVQILVP